MIRRRAVLERALQALGGLERLKQIDSIYLKGKGSEFRSADLQGPDPDTPTRAFHEETIAVLPLQNKLLYEHRTGRHDGSFRWRRWMYAGEQRTVLDLRDEFISNVQRDPAAARERARLARCLTSEETRTSVRMSSLTYRARKYFSRATSSTSTGWASFPPKIRRATT